MDRVKIPSSEESVQVEVVEGALERKPVDAHDEGLELLDLGRVQVLDDCEAFPRVVLRLALLALLTLRDEALLALDELEAAPLLLVDLDQRDLQVLGLLVGQVDWSLLRFLLLRDLDLALLTLLLLQGALVRRDVVLLLRTDHHGLLDEDRTFVIGLRRSDVLLVRGRQFGRAWRLLVLGNHDLEFPLASVSPDLLGLHVDVPNRFKNNSDHSSRAVCSPLFFYSTFLFRRFLFYCKI